MTIMTWISNHIVLVAVIVVILFFIIRYLYTSGYFKKIGLDFNTENFKKTIQSMQGEDDFFAPAKTETKSSDDFFNTNISKDMGGVK